MKTIKKNVYYCDFCNKRTLSASHGYKHEKHCTANPDRKCKMCGRENGVREIVETIKEKFIVEPNKLYYEGVGEENLHNPKYSDTHLVRWVNEPLTLESIQELVEGCPCCTLAILRQTQMNRHYFHLEKYDFKIESGKYLAEKYSENHSWEY